ncbi:MAG TPA: hypothetical protein VF268_10665 [Gammaproteobacteria bacterium]
MKSGFLLLALAAMPSFAADRAPFRAQEPPKILRDLPVYVGQDSLSSDQQKEIVSKGGRLVKRADDEYLYWYLSGENVVRFTSFYLSNRLKIHAVTSVKDISDYAESKYVYSYQVHVHADSPQPLLKFVLKIPAKYYVDIEAPEDWKYTIYYDKISFNKKRISEGLRPEESVSISINSSYPPRYRKLSAMGFYRGPIISEYDYSVENKYDFEDFGFTVDEISVHGDVIGPGNDELSDLDEEIDILLAHSEKWGWLKQEAISDMREILEKKDKDKIDMAEVIERLHTIGRSSPEVGAMLLEFKRNLSSKERKVGG